MTIGSALYLLWRSPSLLAFEWFDAVGLGGILSSARAMVAPASPWIPSWVLYSLPGGLWAYASTSWLWLIWAGVDGASAMVWRCLVPALAVGSELAQIPQAVPGVFDFLDLGCYLLGSLLAITVNRRQTL